MHPLIARLFEKKGINDVRELSPDDQVEFHGWQKVFTQEDVSLEQVKKFCRSQLDAIEGHWSNLDNSNQKNERLIIQHTVYKTLLNLISAPSESKANLERYLQEMIDKP